MPFQFRKEAIEEDLNSNFPSQGQGNPPLYYSLSEVVVPTYSINNVAEGTSLPESLQQAWDLSTSAYFAKNTTVTVVSNTGFWLIDLNAIFNSLVGTGENARVILSDGITSKDIWKAEAASGGASGNTSVMENKFIVFVKSGETVTATTSNANISIDIWTRQVADLNGNLINPLGFSFA